MEPFITDMNGFVLARDVRAAGRTTALAGAVRRGELERVRRGVYRRPPLASEALPPAQRAARDHRDRVLASAVSLQSPVFTSYSAAALHGLPIVGPWPSAVYHLATGRHGHRAAATVTVARMDGVATHVVNGHRVTSIEHTLLQLCRNAPLGAALVATDAALCSMPWMQQQQQQQPQQPQQQHPQQPLSTIDRLWDEHRSRLPYPGSRRTVAVLRRATHLAATPLETCSRLVMEEFGFPRPLLQHPIALVGTGETAYLDFYWDEFDVGGEADGNGKYLGGEGAAASSRTVIREKKREEAVLREIRALERWDWHEMWGRRVLVSRLQRLGLPGGQRRLRLF